MSSVYSARRVFSSSASRFEKTTGVTSNLSVSTRKSQQIGQNMPIKYKQRLRLLVNLRFPSKVTATIAVITSNPCQNRLIHHNESTKTDPLITRNLPKQTHKAQANRQIAPEITSRGPGITRNLSEKAPEITSNRWIAAKTY